MVGCEQRAQNENIDRKEIRFKRTQKILFDRTKHGKRTGQYNTIQKTRNQKKQVERPK